ncbi:MAG: RNA methyltransferase [Pseudomonadota bacterium]
MKDAPERTILPVEGPARVMELLEVLPERVEEVLLPKSAKGGWRTPLEDLCRSRGIRLTTLPYAVFEKLHDRPEKARKVYARFRHEEFHGLGALLKTPPGAGDTVLVLDQVEDPGNLGAMIRSAVWFGVKDIVLPVRRAAPVTGTVAVRSAGALAHARIFRVNNLGNALDDLKEAGYFLYGSVVEGGEPLPGAALTGPAALIIGSEAKGMREGIRGRCDHLLTLPPASGIGSLNASVFAGLFLYERWRGLFG